MSKRSRWGGSYFLEGGSRKGGFGRTPEPPGYAPGFVRHIVLSVRKSLDHLANA